MRKVESLSLKYLGYKDPQDKDEVELELLGLETIIAAARQRIAVLKQSIKLTEIMRDSVVEVEPNAQNVQKTSDSTETK